MENRHFDEKSVRFRLKYKRFYYCRTESDYLPCKVVKEILKVHNTYRQEVARGWVRGQPKASNMREMYWDRELEIEAQNWANHCIFEQNSRNNRKVERFEVGQNLALTRSTGIPNKNIKPKFKTIIELWFSENTKYNFGQLGGIKETGHYTQVVWADTYLIGCAYIHYKKDEVSNQLYVCNYGPRGNEYKDKPYLMPYQIGKERCSLYGLLDSKTYKGLCAVKDHYPVRCMNGSETRRSLTIPKKSPKKFPEKKEEIPKTMKKSLNKKKKSQNKKKKSLSKMEKSAKTQKVSPKQEEESLKPMKESLHKEEKSTKTEKESAKITEKFPKKKEESIKEKKESSNQEKVVTGNVNNGLKMSQTVKNVVYYDKIPKEYIEKIIDYAKMQKKVKNLHFYILINSVKSSNIII